MTDETKTAELPPTDTPPVAEDPTAGTPAVEAAAAMFGIEGRTDGVWRCLNERCGAALAGATFVGPDQPTVQATGEHVVCPACGNDPGPHYIYVGPNEAKIAATAAGA